MMKKAVILAAGRGRRLIPLTDLIAKSLLPVNAKAMIEQVIESLECANFKEIVVVKGYLGDQIVSFIKDLDPGPRIKFVDQEKPMGSADAIKRALHLMEGDFLVTASDSLFTSQHIKKLWDYHIEEGCDATLSLKRILRDRIPSSSTVLTDGEGNILKIIEKPRDEEILGDISSSPMYVFSPAVETYMETLNMSVRGEYEITSVIQEMIDDGLKVKGQVTRRWSHMTDVGDFLNLNFPYIKRVL